MKRIMLVILVVLSVMCINLNVYADNETNTGYQSESAWVPITLILTCVTIAIIATINGGANGNNIIKGDIDYDKN